MTADLFEPSAPANPDVLYPFPPLTKGKLVKRYKRFLADVALADGTVITAHCANSGSMLGLKDPDMPVWLSPNTSKTAKLSHRLEVVDVGTSLVGVHTSRPNDVAFKAIQAGLIPELTGYDSIRAEVKYGVNSRIDILLESADKPPVYVEVKNTTLRRPDGIHPTSAEFPDAVTTRGTKHLNELANEVKNGNRAVMLYFVNRNDCDSVRICGDIDPDYEQAFKHARAVGVEAIAMECAISESGLGFKKMLPVFAPE